MRDHLLNPAGIGFVTPFQVHVHEVGPRLGCPPAKRKTTFVGVRLKKGPSTMTRFWALATAAELDHDPVSHGSTHKVTALDRETVHADFSDVTLANICGLQYMRIAYVYPCESLSPGNVRRPCVQGIETRRITIMVCFNCAKGICLSSKGFLMSIHAGYLCSVSVRALGIGARVPF